MNLVGKETLSINYFKLHDLSCDLLDIKKHIKMPAALFSQFCLQFFVLFGWLFSLYLVVKKIPYWVLQPDKKSHWTSTIQKMLSWHCYIPRLYLVCEIHSLSGKVPLPKCCCSPNPVSGETCWYTYALNTLMTHKQLLSAKHQESTWGSPLVSRVTLLMIIHSVFEGNGRAGQV